LAVRKPLVAIVFNILKWMFYKIRPRLTGCCGLPRAYSDTVSPPLCTPLFLRYVQALWITRYCKFWMDCIESPGNCRRLSTVYISRFALPHRNPGRELVLVAASRANRMASLISV